MTAEEKESLKHFTRYIVGILQPSYVLPYMTTWMTQRTQEQIMAEESRGRSAAAEMLMKQLLELETEGWYQGFIDAVNAAGYCGLSQALQHSDFESIERLEEPRRLLTFIRGIVKNNINTAEILIYFNDCLIERDIEEIQQVIRQNGEIAGAEKLIDCLLLSDKIQWPKTFTMALEEEGCKEVLEVWITDKESDKKQQTTEDLGEGTSVMEIQFCDEPMLLDTCLSASPEVDHQCKPVVSKMSRSNPTSIKLKKLRNYQEELAQPAYGGKNTIVCAPTGSGKTFVALSICEHHLKTIPEGQKGKVVFMATKVPVYEQQKDIFSQYFEDTGYTVVGISGEESDSLPVGLMIENNDIIILTPQILVNSLNNGFVPSLSIFSLMIFDECHNTIGNHPYNVLMFSYLDLKLGSSRSKLPQIVGLTASVGIGKSQRTEDAVQYIHKLCASLDTEVISTVKQHMEELKKVVFKPEKEIFETKRRDYDPFVEIMSEIMTDAEQMAIRMYPSIVKMSNVQSRNFGTQNYEQWIIDVQKKCRTLQLEDKKEESRICNALFTYTEHLRKFNDALMINDDARTIDALNYLRTFFNDIKNGTFTSIERELAKKFEDKIPLLMNIANDNENPKLQELEFIILERYHETPETSTLLFVKTRALVVALKKWIEETPSLSFLNPEMLIGKNKRNEDTGMTLQSQKGALETFKNSDDSKLLIATSVADEGIDIPECNLVLLYEYVGNVTKMIQVRGRGRAKDSKCFLITSKREQAEKERCNLLHEQLMEEAVAQLQKQDMQEFLKQNFQFQRQEKTIRDLYKNLERRVLSEENRRLLCGRCKTFACNTDDIRIIQVSHHTVIDKTFKDRYVTKPHSKQRGFDGYKKLYKIFCKNEKCGEDWGISGNYQNLQNIPLIKIDKFVVEKADGSQHYFPKWVKVDFKMKEFKGEEIDESFSMSQ